MNELTIYSVFQKIIDKSFVLEGRFHVASSYGNDLNADNLEAIVEEQRKQGEVKYPMALLFQPFETIKSYKLDMRSLFDINIYFLATTFYSGDGQVQNPDKYAGTSNHPIKYYWADMARCAKDFLRVLSKLSRENPFLREFINIDSDDLPIIERVSLVNNNRLSGVRLAFKLIMSDMQCKAEDYPEEDIKSIDFSDIYDDIHPIHKL